MPPIIVLAAGAFAAGAIVHTAAGTDQKGGAALICGETREGLAIVGGHDQIARRAIDPVSQNRVSQKQHGQRLAEHQ